MTKRLVTAGLLAMVTLFLSACGTSLVKGNKSTGGAYLPGDGPGKADAAKIANIPDAVVPRKEPLHPYANRPYEALGVRYVPLTRVGVYQEKGVASWYGKKFHGQRTSSGEVYDMYGMTAAHKTLPIPSYARVTNTKTGKTIVVRVNDRGPFLHGRIIDLSYAAATKLGIVENGSAEVEVTSLDPDGDGSSVIYTKPAAPEPIVGEALPIQTNIPSANKADGTVYLQLGAFTSPQAAESFLGRMQAELSDTKKNVILYPKKNLFCVHVGPYRTVEEARAAAPGMHSRLGFRPFVSVH